MKEELVKEDHETLLNTVGPGQVQRQKATSAAMLLRNPDDESEVERVATLYGVDDFTLIFEQYNALKG